MIVQVANLRRKTVNSLNSQLAPSRDFRGSRHMNWHAAWDEHLCTHLLRVDGHGHRGYATLLVPLERNRAARSGRSSLLAKVQT